MLLLWHATLHKQTGSKNPVQSAGCVASHCVSEWTHHFATDRSADLESAGAETPAGASATRCFILHHYSRTPSQPRRHRRTTGSLLFPRTHNAATKGVFSFSRCLVYHRYDDENALCERVREARSPPQRVCWMQGRMWSLVLVLLGIARSILGDPRNRRHAEHEESQNQFRSRSGHSRPSVLLVASLRLFTSNTADEDSPT